MRQNLPVTQREYLIKAGETLLSTTDTKGRITYANEAFIRVSGFSKAELYGQPHNLVRHPDMPAEAFEDLWATLQAGETWSALVKNRRSDGDYYWVRANVTPVRDGHSVVGYMSVRTAASPEEIALAAPIYQQLGAGKGSPWRIHKGMVQRTHWASRLGCGQPLSISARLSMAVGAITAVAMACVTSLSPTAADGLWSSLSMASVALLVSVWLHRTVSLPLRGLVTQARQVASGQPAQPMFRCKADDIGALMQGIEQAGLNLTALVGDIQDKVGGVKQAVEGLQDGNLDLYSRTGLAADKLKHTASAMEELACTIKSNKEAAHSLAQFAVKTSEATQQGKVMVAQAISTMEGITKSSQQVTDITSLIDHIAFQTNILALNAAVEAARAGVHGRGFAVVASEVRALSQKSSEAAKEIKRLIDSSKQQTDTGAQVVQRAGTAMDGIASIVTNLTTLIQEISVASEEQACGLEQVNGALLELEQMTLQNTELAETNTAATMGLADAAEHLSEAAAVFTPWTTLAETGHMETPTMMPPMAQVA